MSTLVPPGASDQDLEAWFIDHVSRIQPSVTVPGYWQGLANNCAGWAGEVLASEFWRRTQAAFPRWCSGYAAAYGGDLVRGGSLPSFTAKGIDRIKGKSRALSIKKGVGSVWDPSRSIPALNDLVRTRIACAYLDGVEFLGDCLEALAAEMGIEHSRDRQGRLEGYFAQHFYFAHSVLFRWAGRNEMVTVSCEIQMATELSTQVWASNHPNYERWRERAEKPEEWQWKPEDPRFIARQLGHMLHLADGLLVQLRNIGKRGSGNS